MKEQNITINGLLEFLNALEELVEEEEEEEVEEDEVEIEIPFEVEVEIPFADDDEIPLCESDSCEGCHYAESCDLPYGGCDDIEPDMWGVPAIDRVVFSGRATIVFWEDGTKTVVKAMEGEKVERYAGFCAACMKKMFGSTSRAKTVMKACTVEQSQPVKKKTPDVAVPDMTEAFVIQQAAHNEAIQEAIDEALG